MGETGGMTKRARVLAALRGEPVDRVPLAFWLHNFATENSADGLAAESVRLARSFDWDYLKPQSRAQCFAEMWGLRYRPSSERALPFTVVHAPVASPADLGELEPADPRGGALGEQLRALRAIRAAVGADTPILWTVFAPAMVMAYMVSGGRALALELARSAPAAAERALRAITETLAAYARLAVEHGADGLFYATNVATRDLVSDDECRWLHRPWDLEVLAAVESAPFNVLHVCGAGARFDAFVDYPVDAFSWATVPGNPDLADGHRRTGRAVIGGLPAKPEIAAMSPEQISARARDAVAAMNGRWLLLGPDCSVNPDTPEELFHAARAGATRPSGAGG
jgi:uroporphyrinogen decarboxylase